MIKVIIADDEDRICRLIEALIDWKAFGMEIAGAAHNGIEACEMIRKIRPDILITDIRMPGCSGLELIRQVKEILPELEIMIISGYAQFEYAQQAILCGVGYYLLKPISRTELEMNLAKMQQRILERKESREDRLEQARRDDYHLQEKLIDDLTDENIIQLTQQQMREVYHFPAEPGLYQAVCLRMDCQPERISSGSVSVLLEKVRELFEQACSEKKIRQILSVREMTGIGILNYPEGEKENVKALLKNCFHQAELQKDLFCPVQFTMAEGTPVNRAEDLQSSMKEALLLIEERLLRGTGRIYENLGKPSGVADGGLLEKYLRSTSQAVEILDIREGDRAAEQLRSEMKKRKDVRGYEVLNLVLEAANVYSAANQVAERSRELQNFRDRCRFCSSEEEIFRELKEFQGRHIRSLKELHEKDQVRPVRNAKQYIQNHFSEPITLEGVSEIVGLSPAYFSALFKKTEGEGFAKYLINVRMEQAKILLRESNAPVTEICKKVGYNDIRHFTHTFEKAAGVKPSVYRKLYG